MKAFTFIVRLLIPVVAAAIFGYVAAGCSARQPVRIGFAGDLTGLNAVLGVDGRDGAQLAVDLINTSGGMNGRTIELIVRDDRGDPETARRVDAELISLGAVAVVGHFTSSQTAVVFKQMNDAATVLLSPTTTSVDFSHQDDYFFRVIPDIQGVGRTLAAHMVLNRNIRRIVGVYDTGNGSYTNSVWQAVDAEFTRLGGKDAQTIPFVSGEADLKELVEQISSVRPEGVVFIASSIDTALIIQYYRQAGGTASLFSAPWAQTDEFLNKGGKAIEGVEMTTFFDPENPYPNFQKFLVDFETRYHRQPGFPAAYAYESVLVLAEALQKTNGEKRGLKSALTGLHEIEGVQGVFAIDRNGDVQRDIYVAVVENGRFRIIEKVPAIP